MVLTGFQIQLFHKISFCDVTILGLYCCFVIIFENTPSSSFVDIADKTARNNVQKLRFEKKLHLG